MNKKNLFCVVLGFLLLLVATLAQAQTSAYFQAITNLHPVGYWPMHEVEIAAPGDIETNYGTLGPLGTGFYPDWVGGPGMAIQHQVPGALTGDADTAVNFGTYGGNSVSWTNQMYIPHTTPLTTLNPPFSVECWYYTTNGASVGNDIWSQNGLEGLNAGPTGGNVGAIGGIRLFGSGSGLTLYTFKPGQNNLGNVTGLSANTWYHIVVTCDAQTNFSLYVNNVQKLSNISAVTKYTPDYWTPFEVGNGRGNTRANTCRVDELAIYTNVLANIGTHYNAGLDPVTYGAYYTNVLADNPVVYLRMDGPTYTAPAVGTWPVLTNYGSLAANGVYTPGTMPGVAKGPVNPGSSVSFSGVPGTVPQLSGVSSYGDAGYALEYNPVGAKSFTIIALFRGNPADGRIQTIVGHSDSSWQIDLTTLGKIQCQLGTNTTSQIISARVYNDGNWHQLVEVYTPASNPALTGTNSLYMDGVLDTAVNTVTSNGILPGSSMDVLIGSDPQYTNNPVGVGQQLAGQACDVALFTNALTAAQIRILFNATGEILPAFIGSQPKANNNNGAVVFTVLAGGTSPLAYQWYSNTSSNYSGATLLTDGGGVSGSTNGNLTITDPSLYYFVVVTNNYGSVTSLVASAATSTPIFTTQFPIAYGNLWLFPGFNHTFSITAIGGSPLYYQWFTNGVAVGSPVNSGSSSVSTSISLTNVQTQFTNYYCVVSNAFGSVTSFVWSASIFTVPSSYAQAVVALNPIGYWRLNEPDDGFSDGNPDVVCHDYVGGNGALYTNVYLGQPGYNAISDPTDTSVQVGSFRSANSYAGFIGTNIDFATPSGNNAEFSVEAWVSPGSSSSGGLVAKGYNGGGEEFVLTTANTSHYFQFLLRPAIANAQAAVTASSTIAPQDGVWYHLVGVCDQANGNVMIYVNGVLAGSASMAPGAGITGTTSWPLTIGSQAANQNSDVTGYTRQSQAYINDVAVFNYALSSNQIANEYNMSGVPPAFTQPPPASTNINPGGTLVVSFPGISGTPPLSYQWYDVNAGPTAIPGQTNTTLMITNILASDSYYLTVTNLYGSTNSDNVAAYVGPAIITQSPSYTNLLLYAGAHPTFSIIAGGAPILHYSWLTNGVVAGGATNASYTLNSLQSGSPTNYDCIVSNSVGAATGMVWTVSIIPISAAYPAAIVAAHPIGYWPLNEGPDDGAGNNGIIANDYFGGNNGIYTNTLIDQTGYDLAGNPGETSAEFGTSVFADSDVYGIPTNVNFSVSAGGNAAFSIEAWVKGYQQTKDAGIVTKGYASGGEQFDLDTGSDTVTTTNPVPHSYRFLIRDASGGVYSVNSSVNPADGVWHHLVGVCDEINGAVTFYIDGNSVGVTSITPGSGILSSPRSMLIGSRPSNSTIKNNDLQFVGWIQDVAVYNYALSASQVLGQYQVATGQTPTTPTLSIKNLGGGQVQLTWSVGTLQSATNLNGSFIDIPNVNSPYTIPATNTQQFYRAHNP